MYAGSLKLDCNSSYNRMDSYLGARSINAYKVDAIRQSRCYTIVTENGLAIGSGLPLPIGRLVEVIILDSETLDRLCYCFCIQVNLSNCFSLDLV